tara:strand:+ start:19305 stop:20075 length:771 start_codon:yes stop_codon:yes gene_type:complete
MTFQLNPPSNGLIGHRGLAHFAPENTLIGFQMAKSKGLEWIEFDVQLSNDNELMIIHDHNLNRTTNGNGLIYEQHSEILSKLDAGSWFNEKFTGTTIPNLDKDLAKILSLDLNLNIEIKCPKETDQNYKNTLADKIITLIKHKWSPSSPLPLVSSFEWPILLKIRDALPEQPIGFLCEILTADVLRIAAQVGNATINCHYPNLSEQQIYQAQALDIPLLVFTVNQQDAANKLIDSGVFGVFTDILTDTYSSVRKVV